MGWNQTSTLVSVGSYVAAQRLYERTKVLRGYTDLRPLNRRSINATQWIEKDPYNNDYRIKLHRTYVVTYHEDGDVTLRTNGWIAGTTANAITTCSPMRAYRYRGYLFVSSGGKHWAISDEGTRFTQRDGAWIPLRPVEVSYHKQVVDRAAAQRARAQYKEVATYIESFTTCFAGGNVPAEGIIDSWAFRNRIQAIADTPITDEMAQKLAWNVISVVGNTRVQSNGDAVKKHLWDFVYKGKNIRKSEKFIIPEGERLS